MDPEQQTNVSFEQFLGVLRRRAPWVVACVVLAAGIAYGYSKHKTKQYTATAAVNFVSNPLYQQISGLSTSGGETGLALQASDLELVRLGATAVQTAHLLGLTPQTVRASLSIGGKGESNIVEVTASSTSPTLAAAIANTYVARFVKDQQQSNHLFFKAALAAVYKQLAALPPAQRVGPDALDLQTRAHTLELLLQLGYNNVQVAQEALVPAAPSSPRTSKNTALGAALGLLIGLAIAFLLERFDRRIRQPEDLGEIYHLPMLGVIPKSAALTRPATHGKARVTLPASEAEAFSLIRAHLRFFNVDRELRTVMIASPESDDGKTTVALYLAMAAASLGSRVLLMEIDLRQPTISRQLGIDAPGLVDVLIGDVTTDQATQSVLVQTSSQTGQGRTLDALTAGRILPPNPGELLDSRSMAMVLEQAKSAYDLVVIDTPPLTAVSDAFPLLAKVDGVVVVGRIDRSHRDAAEQLHQVLLSSGAPLLGVIANGSKSGGLRPYPGRDTSASPAVPASSTSSEDFVSAAKT